MSWTYKTSAGAYKRAAFENAHDKRGCTYSVVRFFEGAPDDRPLHPDRVHGYTWRIKREKWQS